MTDIAQRPLDAADDRADIVEGWVRSNLPRLVAALGPIIAAAVAAVTYWLQDVIGIDLQKHNAAAAAFIGLVLLGALSFGVTWLHNAGKGQIAIATRYAEDLIREGHRVGEPLAPGVTEGDMGVDPDSGTDDFMGPDPAAPSGEEEPHQPLE